MKTILLILALLPGVTNSHAGVKKNVTDDVLRSFSTKYPGAHVKKWMSRNDTDIAVFKLSKVRECAYYLPNGTWLRTETEINDIPDLPKVVENNWHQCAFQGWFVEDVKHVETADNNLYKIVVTRKYVPGGFPGAEEWVRTDMMPEVFALYFNADGTLVKKVLEN